MHARRPLIILMASLLAVPAFAQTVGNSLNLQLPPDDLPAAASTAGNHPHAAPGVYYGDTSGRKYTAAAAHAPACEDSTYNQTQMHGSVSTGVVSAGHRGSGTWGGANVNISKAFGSCEHPSGGVSISIGGGSGHFHGHTP